jgi:hypothetical protein
MSGWTQAACGRHEDRDPVTTAMNAATTIEFFDKYAVADVEKRTNSGDDARALSNASCITHENRRSDAEPVGLKSPWQLLITKSEGLM